MSLFVGNVSKKVTQKQFEDAFKTYGPCKVDLRVISGLFQKRFAFVQYDNDRHAEQAKKDLQNKNFSGLRLNIEWSKNSGRFNENAKSDQKHNNTRKYYNNNDRPRSRSRDRSWRRGDDKWHRRSPSYEKRSSPTYSENEDIDYDTYEPQCPRDRNLLKILIERREKKR